MKILLDENLPLKLAFDFDKDYDVYSVRKLGWGGKKNGELLKLMIENSFEVFITLDKNLRYQQNIEKFKICIFLLKVKDSKHQTIQPLVPKILKYLKSDLEKELIEIQ